MDASLGRHKRGGEGRGPYYLELERRKAIICEIHPLGCLQPGFSFQGFAAGGIIKFANYKSAAGTGNLPLQPQFPSTVKCNLSI